MITIENRDMKLHHLLIPVIATTLLSCSTPSKIAYFQDTADADYPVRTQPQVIRLQPEDKISIIVNCQDSKVANLFNLPFIARQIGQPSDFSSSYSQGISGYTIQQDGTIDFPLLGKIEAKGLTRTELADKIKSELTGRSLVKDPVITVEYMNLFISVIGEVNRPGRYPLTQDSCSLLEALSQAGDLTIYGRRDNVRVIRAEGGSQHTYRVDLCNAESVMSSPVFYLRQNDLIYVEPNDVRQRQSTVNGNNVRSTSFWISLASLMTSVTLMVYNLVK